MQPLMHQRWSYLGGGYEAELEAFASEQILPRMKNHTVIGKDAHVWIQMMESVFRAKLDKRNVSKSLESESGIVDTPLAGRKLLRKRTAHVISCPSIARV